MSFILDMNLPDLSGKEVAKSIKEKYPKVHIIIFTGYDYVPYLNLFLESGVSGMLSKNASIRQIIRMIESVMDGETVLPLSVYQCMRIQPDVKQSPRALNFSEKENEIISMLVKGCTNAMIAKKIFMSVRSVENYMAKIYEKLEVKSRVEAVEKITREERMVY